MIVRTPDVSAKKFLLNICCYLYLDFAFCNGVSDLQLF
jgi:hypothetical protein